MDFSAGRARVENFNPGGSAQRFLNLTKHPGKGCQKHMHSRAQGLEISRLWIPAPSRRAPASVSSSVKCPAPQGHCKHPESGVGRVARRGLPQHLPSTLTEGWDLQPVSLPCQIGRKTERATAKITTPRLDAKVIAGHWSQTRDAVWAVFNPQLSDS
jgi:hypothetical protein